MKGERYCKCSGERKHWRGWVSGGQTIKYGGHVPDTQNLLMNIYWKNSEEAMAPHSSTLAWKVPWMEEPGRLQSMGSLRVRHEWATSLSLSCIGEGNGNPLQCSCLENPRDGEPGGLPSIGLHRVGHDQSGLAAAAALEELINIWPVVDIYLYFRVCKLLLLAFSC